MHLMENDNLSNISEGLRQVFENKFTINIGLKEIIKMKNNGAITDRDLKISRLLFKFKFATVDQIYEILSLTADANEIPAAKINIKNRLDKLVKYHVINKFMLTMDQSIDAVQPDAMQFYCLDLGGRHLLSHYSNEDVADWYTIENMKASEIIKKDIQVFNFHLSLMRSCPNRISYFNVGQEMKLGKKNFSPHFEFLIENNGVKNYFIGEIVNSAEFPMLFRERLIKLEELFTTSIWKKYYYDAQIPPVLLLIADSDDLAKNIAEMITETTELDRYRITTIERIKMPLFELGAFMKYESKEEPLKEIRASSFLP